MSGQMTLKEKTNLVLDEARRILSRDGSWTQGAYARDEEGNESFVTSERACSFCLSGAVQRAYRNLGLRYFTGDAMDRLHDAIVEDQIARGLAPDRLLAVGVPAWNDRIAQSVDEVLAIIDKAKRT